MNRSLALLFIVYDEKHGQNCSRFGTRGLDGKSCLIPHIHHVYSRKVCREDQVLKAEDKAQGFQHFSPGLANVIVDGKNKFLFCLLPLLIYIHSQLIMSGVKF